MKRGFETALLACLLTGCAAEKAGPPAQAAPAAQNAEKGFKLTAVEKDLVSTWQAERGMTAGDAMSNVLLRRYESQGHTVRYADNGLYEVLDKKNPQAVVATFFIKADVK